VTDIASAKLPTDGWLDIVTMHQMSQGACTLANPTRDAATDVNHVTACLIPLHGLHDCIDNVMHGHKIP
jgi:hypothetical protein